MSIPEEWPGFTIEAIKDRMVTYWFPVATRPEHIGWYQVDAPHSGFVFAKWDGFKWLLPSSWVGWHPRAFRLDATWQLIVMPMAMLAEIGSVRHWRGLTRDHGHTSDEHLNLRYWYEPAAQRHRADGPKDSDIGYDTGRLGNTVAGRMARAIAAG